MSAKKYLFIDRDGTLIDEPSDFQVDDLTKLRLKPGVIPALLRLRDEGYHFVMVSNQDGMGTDSFPKEAFEAPHSFLLELLRSQGITFEAVLICPHTSIESCLCRKPHLGMVRPWLTSGSMDYSRSYVIGDRPTDRELAENMGILSIQIDNGRPSWAEIADQIIRQPRRGVSHRTTKETSIRAEVNLDGYGLSRISTGIGYFDHMLEQLAKHGNFDLMLEAAGDLHVDEHHTVEDAAITIGEALRQAIGDKVGISRYGFCLPMDEAECQASLDLSGRTYFVFRGSFPRERVGELPTEMVPHFYRSLAESLKATLHITVTGENAHHMVESTFKAVGRCLRMSVGRNGRAEIPSTKGLL